MTDTLGRWPGRSIKGWTRAGALAKRKASDNHLQVEETYEKKPM
jgi:hypothetical protein